MPVTSRVLRFLVLSTYAAFSDGSTFAGFPLNIAKLRRWLYSRNQDLTTYISPVRERKHFKQTEIAFKFSIGLLLGG